MSDAGGRSYESLPWHDLRIGTAVGKAEVSLLANTHRLIVDGAIRGATVRDRLRLLGQSVADFYTGLTADDGEQLAAEWVEGLGDLAGRGWLEAGSWSVLFGESTGGWWPPGSRRLTRGVVNAVVRSPYVEELHRSERTTFLDNQLGTMTLLWAAVSVLEPIMSPNPATWGASEPVSPGHFSMASSLFPGGLAVIRALGSAGQSEPGVAAVVWPTDVSEVTALTWLREHAGVHTTSSQRLLGGPVSVRSAWTSPSDGELDTLADAPVLVLPNVTRLSRSPVHLAALIEWFAATGRTILTPNVMLTREAAHVRQPFVPSPVPNATGGHEASWVDVSGLSDAHAETLRLAVGGRTKALVGRNEPCPCGSGRKYKRCHG